jgi:hypothetical protein
MPKAGRVVLAVVGVVVVLIGLMIWNNPAEFSGAQTGDVMRPIKPAVSSTGRGPGIGRP